MKRVKKLPRRMKTIKEWDTPDWCWELCQKADGDFVIYGAAINSADFVIEQRSTIKGCLAAARRTDAEVEATLSIPE